MPVRYVRFATQKSPQSHYGILEGDVVTQLFQPPWVGVEKGCGQYQLKEIRLMAPVEPSKIVCVGLNYRAHVTASFSADKPPESPLLFLKPPSAIIGPGEGIVLPSQSERVDYEAELGVVIGKTASKIKIEDAEQYILGFTCVNDVTARDLQKKDGQWSRAKGFDTFCPVGPWIEERANFRDLLVEGILNETVMQAGRTSLMIFDIPFLITYISQIMTLFPGDLISTGTPSGISPMKSGDKIEVRIEEIGTLQNRVI